MNDEIEKLKSQAIETEGKLLIMFETLKAMSALIDSLEKSQRELFFRIHQLEEKEGGMSDDTKNNSR